MSDQIEKIDIRFKGIESSEAQLIIAYAKMHAFIHEWQYKLRDMVKHGELKGELYDQAEKIKQDFHDGLYDFGIAQLFD